VVLRSLSAFCPSTLSFERPNRCKEGRLGLVDVCHLYQEGNSREADGLIASVALRMYGIDISLKRRRSFNIKYDCFIEVSNEVSTLCSL
jgi:hypothetical protein